MTVSYEQINLKFILMLVTLFSVVAGGGGSWAMMKFTITNVVKDQQEAKETLIETSSKMSAKIEKVAALVQSHDYHALDRELHMPYTEKMKTFVPRTAFDTVVDSVNDLDVRQRAIISSLDRIEAKLDN